jgi:SAM-dependent methyltransferase
MTQPSDPTGAQQVRDKVREGYAAIANSEKSSCCGPSSCCGADTSEAANQLAVDVGYDLDEIQALPDGANMGLSCGNPVALASLKPGEVVIDLGSGGGFDVFIAGRKVGQRGRAIGIDMTAEMLAKARRNTAAYRERTGFDNVEFRLGEIEHLPTGDNTADVVISNCVVNLSPSKAQVWREIARVLKPNGRVAVSDIALLKPLPPQVAEMVEALVGCVAGAVLVEETRQMARDAGLAEVTLTTMDDYFRSMTKWHDPLYQQIAAALPAGETLSDYITSLEVTARKPRRACCC